MSKRKQRPLNKRERLLLKYLAEGLSPNAAGIKAGYASSGAWNIANKVIRNNPNKWKKILEKAGITEKSIAETISEAQEATKLDGKFDNEVPDHNVRLKAVDMVLKMTDEYPSEKHELTGKDGESLNPPPKVQDYSTITTEELIKIMQAGIRKT